MAQVPTKIKSLNLKILPLCFRRFLIRFTKPENTGRTDSHVKFDTTPLKDLWLISPRRITDRRGYFMETFRHDLFEDAIGAKVTFVQENQSFSQKSGTLRGLHVQIPPHAQGKLIRCLRGEIFDVAVDIRKNSPTYGRWYGELLNPENAKQFWIPQGFLHGFQTTRPDTEIAYKCTGYYHAESERTIAWNDPFFGIEWQEIDPVLSDKDRQAPGFSAIESPF